MSEFQDDDVVMDEWYDHEKNTTNISFEFTNRALINNDTAKWLLKNLKMLWTDVAKIRGRSLADELELACDHADWTSSAYSDGIYVDMGYRYCPKCGEKL